MIRHIVFFRLADDVPADQRMAMLNEVKFRLEELPVTIPEILSMEIGINLASDQKAADLALVSSFYDEAALQTYQKHPAHQDFIVWNRSRCPKYSVVDYKF